MQSSPGSTLKLFAMPPDIMGRLEISKTLSMSNELIAFVGKTPFNPLL